jgi:hypothetical protein
MRYHSQQLQSECCTSFLSGCRAAAGMSWQLGIQRRSRRKRKHEKCWENNAGFGSKVVNACVAGKLGAHCDQKNVEIWSALCLKPPAMPLIFACRLGCEVASGWMGKKMKTRMYIRTFVCCSVPDWKSWCLGKHGVLIVPKPDVWGIVAPTKVWRMSYCWDIFWGLLAISVQLTMCGNQICLEMFGCFL